MTTSNAKIAWAAGLALAMTAVVPGARRAEACSCRTPTIEVFPGPNAPIPTNAHVWVFIPKGAWPGGADVPVAKLTFTIKLHTLPRPAPKPAKGSKAAPAPTPAIKAEADRRDFGGGELSIVELVPRAPLEPKTRYDVLLSREGGKDAVVGELTTSEAADTTAPEWGAAPKGALVKLPAAPGRCSTGAPFAEITLEPAKDDGGGAVVYGVWLADAAGKIDWDAAPATVAHERDGKVQLGKASMCEPDDLPLPAGEKALHLGVKPLDAAGNAGKPAEVTIDLSPPAPPHLPAKKK